MALDSRLLAVLACPQDKGPLYYLGVDGTGTDQGLYNPRLRRRYTVRDGIPIMLIDEAVDASDTDHETIMADVAARQLPPTFVT